MATTRTRKKEATTPAKSTPAKTVTLTPKTPAKPAIPAATATPAKIVKPAQPVKTTDVMRKPEFIEKTVERSGLKKKDVKPALETALAVLGDALAQGQELNLPPLGKIKLVKSKDLEAGAKAYTLRLRTRKTEA